MLILSRSIEESIMIGGTEVKILYIGETKVKLGITASPEITILRKELINEDA